MITKTIKIEESQEKFLLKNYKNVNQGVQACIEKAMYPSNDESTLRYIRSYSKKELRGKFTKEEWFFFIDSLNGSIVDSLFRCSLDALIVHCSDSEELDGTASKYELNFEKLISKCKTLTGAQIEALYTIVEEFWDKEDKDLHQYVDAVM